MPDSTSVDGLFLYVADDSDFDSISYGGGEDAIWEHTSEGWYGAYKNTGSEGVPGGTASMNFTGLGVFAFAAIPANLSSTAARTAPNVTVTLDDNTPTKVTVPLSTESPFFEAGPLNDGITHTITIRIDEMTDEFPFALDGIIYAAEQNTTKPPSQDTLPPDSSTSGFLQGLLPVETAKQDSGPPVGPIVGGVIGGTALIVIISLVVWYLFIRPRRRGGRAFFYAPAKISDMLSGETVDAKPEPYPLMHPTSTPSMSQVPARQGTLPPTDPSDAESGYGYGVGMGKPGSPYAPSTAGSSEAAAHRRKAEMAGVLSVPKPTTYHADSGIRFNDPSAAGPSSGPAAHDLADVPPTYSEN
ncbi:hypothetical protein GY45DRAFT_1081186 [Cubamyces sp. BRFM 1775]|nr:hypothetical protein GY45DRAFT_1081186 [Cubamyces sp. BRFM 1775]